MHTPSVTRISGLIDRVEQFFFQRRDLRFRIFGTKRAGRRFFRQRHAQIGGTADADADDGRGARFRARTDDLFEHKFLDAVHAVRRDKHFQERHVLRAGTFRDEQNVKALGVADEIVFELVLEF